MVSCNTLLLYVAIAFLGNILLQEQQKVQIVQRVSAQPHSKLDSAKKFAEFDDCIDKKRRELNIQGLLW